LLLSLTSFAQNPTSAVKESAKAAQMRQLNNKVLNLHAQMQMATNPSSRKLLRGQALQVLKTRQTALVALMQENARTALTFAFSPEVLEQLGTNFPESTALLEEHVAMMGGVEHWIADYPNHKAQSLYLMRLGQQPLRLHFAGPEPSLGDNNDVLAVTGIVIGYDMAVESSSVVSSSPSAKVGTEQQGTTMPLIVLGGMFLPFIGGLRSLRRLREVSKQIVVCVVVVLFVTATSTSYAQSASCGTSGAQNTLVLLVNLPNGSLPSGVTQSAMQDVFFGTNTPGISLDGFLREASYGQTWATGDVVGPLNLSGTYTSCSDVSGAVLSDALAAAQAAGYNSNNYSRVVLVFPDILSCGWQGFASVGCGYTTGGVNYNWSPSFISAAYATPRSSGVQLASHEIGHNLGLLHSGTLVPAIATDVIGPLSAPGTENDLGDYWTTMSGSLGLYTAPQNAETLGWVANKVQAVNTSGTYTVQPLEIGTSGIQALKIQRGSNNPGYYLWVEYRQPDNGYDSTLLASAYSGALIHYEEPGQMGSTAHSYLPNFTPSVTTGYNSPLAAGQTWADPYTNLSLSVVSATSAGLTVNVNYGASSCTSANPTVTLSPLDPSIYPGNSAGYNLSVTNNDSSGCSPSTFSLSSTQPSGWPVSFSAGSITISPGQSGSSTMTVTGPSSTSPGTYAVNAVAANNSHSGSGTANITVISAPSVSVNVSVSSSSYTRKSTVPITASVLNGGTPAAGASVTFTLITATGNKVTQSATTGSKGTATWNYKLGPKSPTGTYSVSAQAVLSSTSSSPAQPVSSNTVSFTVH
jgi:M6 family metalloprotease-like protein